MATNKKRQPKLVEPWEKRYRQLSGLVHDTRDTLLLLVQSVEDVTISENELLRRMRNRAAYLENEWAKIERLPLEKSACAALAHR